MNIATIIPLKSGATLLDLGDRVEPFEDRHAAVSYAEALGFRCEFADSPPVEPAPAT